MLVNAPRYALTNESEQRTYLRTFSSPIKALNFAMDMATKGDRSCFRVVRILK